jgi:hypothetical protein
MKPGYDPRTIRGQLQGRRNFNSLIQSLATGEEIPHLMSIYALKPVTELFLCHLKKL